MNYRSRPQPTEQIRRSPGRAIEGPTLKRPSSSRWQMGLVIGTLVGAMPWAGAQIIAWDFNGNAGSETSVAATTQSANLQTVRMTRGAGVAATTLAGSFAANEWDTGNTTLAAAQAANEYFAFTVSPMSGFAASLTTLDANFARTTGAPNQFQWQYSLDGFASAGVSIGSVVAFNSVQDYGQAQNQISLTGISALQSIPATTSVEFRLYVFGATGSTGSVSFGFLDGNDLRIGGSVVSAVPEPATYAGIAGAGALIGARWFRRRPRAR